MIVGHECGGMRRIKTDGCGLHAGHIHIYPMYWSTKADGSGPTAALRELRLNPDGVHLGFNSFAMLGEASGMATLVFNPTPKTGTLVPRYDLEKVTLFYDTRPDSAMFTAGSQAIRATFFITLAARQGNGVDGAATANRSLTLPMLNRATTTCSEPAWPTGDGVRITNDPGYTDPMKTSPDDKWFVAMDTRAVPERAMWYAGMQGYSAAYGYG